MYEQHNRKKHFGITVKLNDGKSVNAICGDGDGQ